MPELPEIYNLAMQLNREITGKKIKELEVRQEKCLNISVSDLRILLTDQIVKACEAKGKWIFVRFESGAYLLLNLGMGGNLLYHSNIKTLPEKYQFRCDFTDNFYLTISFWWFGYIHGVKSGELIFHKMTNTLGLSPFDKAEFTFERFNALLAGKRGNIKSFLLDQRNVAGIGNVYIQDILFKAGLHPNRKIPDITPEERVLLHYVIMDYLKSAAELGGLAYEKDIYNKNGLVKEFLVGYREGKECPKCGIPIEKIKAGSTASFICPHCQR